MLCLATSSAHAKDDRIYFRDGTTVTGRIVSDGGDRYVFSPADAWTTSTIAKERVRFVVYGDQEHISDRLGLDAFRSLCTDAAPTRIRFLPASVFGKEATEAIASAKESIYVMTYTLTGSTTGQIGRLYAALKERAESGAKVYLVAPSGARTHAGVRIRAMNAVEDLAASGVRVRFLDGTIVQHKKLIIIDKVTVFIGSSNLSSAGVSKNVEMNVRIDAPAFATEALEDVRSLLRRAKKPERVLN